MVLTNLDIRLKIDTAGIQHKVLAEEIGITDTSLSRLLRRPLKPEQRERLLYAIRRLEERGHE